jgi:hypothetical protein
MAILTITRRYIWFLHNTPPLQVVRGTLDALASPVQNMGINHLCFLVFFIIQQYWHMLKFNELKLALLETLEAGEISGGIRWRSGRINPLQGGY